MALVINNGLSSSSVFWDKVITPAPTLIISVPFIDALLDSGASESYSITLKSKPSYVLEDLSTLSIIDTSEQAFDLTIVGVEAEVAGIAELSDEVVFEIVNHLGDISSLSLELKVRIRDYYALLDDFTSYKSDTASVYARIASTITAVDKLIDSNNKFLTIEQLLEYNKQLKLGIETIRNRLSSVEELSTQHTTILNTITTRDRSS